MCCKGLLCLANILLTRSKTFARLSTFVHLALLFSLLAVAVSTAMQTKSQKFEIRIDKCLDFFVKKDRHVTKMHSNVCIKASSTFFKTVVAKKLQKMWQLYQAWPARLVGRRVALIKDQLTQFKDFQSFQFWIPSRKVFLKHAKWVSKVLIDM